MKAAPALLCLTLLLAVTAAPAAPTRYTVKNRRIEPNQPLAVALQLSLIHI